MKRIFQIILVVFSILFAVIVFAIIVQYQVRPRFLIGETLEVGLSKGAWAECLSKPLLVGRIDKLRFSGLIVTDISGDFTHDNASLHIQTGKLLCPTLKIVVENAENKQYFIPFRNIGGLRRDKEWFWRNLFAK